NRWRRATAAGAPGNYSANSPARSQCNPWRSAIAARGPVKRIPRIGHAACIAAFAVRDLPGTWGPGCLRWGYGEPSGHVRRAGRRPPLPSMRVSVDSSGQAGEDVTRKDLLEALLATTRALGGPETGSAAAELAEAARLHTGARAAAVWHRDTQNGELTLLVPVRDPPPRLAAGAGLAGRCAEGGRMLLEVDAGTAVDIIAVAMADRDRAGYTGAVLSLPLMAGDAVLGVLQLLYESGRGFDPNTVLLAQVLAAEGALALRHAGPGVANTLHSEVEVARAIQRSTLPTQMPAVSGYDLYGHFQPATYAGGDMFDAVKLPMGVFLLLGDATGHGFGPALSAMEMQGMLRV